MSDEFAVVFIFDPNHFTAFDGGRFEEPYVDPERRLQFAILRLAIANFGEHVLGVAKLVFDAFAFHERRRIVAR